jgi:hypothetical protein
MSQASIKLPGRIALAVAAGVALAFTAVASFAGGPVLASDICNGGGGLGTLCVGGGGSAPTPRPTPPVCEENGVGPAGVAPAKSSEDVAELFCIIR